MAETGSFLGLSINAWLLALLGCVSTIYVLRRKCTLKLDPAEPPIQAPRIPLIGHLLGMFWYQNDYYDLLEYVLQ